MNENTPEIDIDEIMKHIRSEVNKRRKKDYDTSSKISSTSLEEFVVESSISPDERNVSVSCESRIENGKEYSIEELCQYNGINFIANSYRVLLLREPSEDELSIWSSRLTVSALTKKEVLARIRFGAEGRQKKVVVKKLYFWAVLYKLIKIPIFGKILRILGCIYRLPLLFRNVQGIKYNADLRYKQIENDHHLLKSHLDEIVSKLQIILTELSQKADRMYVGYLSDDLEGVNDGLQNINSRLQDTDSRLQDTDSSLQNVNNEFQVFAQRLKAELADVERLGRDAKFNVLAQQRRLDDLLLQGESLIGSVEQTHETQCSTDDHVLDAVYLSFEDRFRGTREDIKNRQKVYLPYVDKVQQETGIGVILDVGCGRGEWLELLKEQDFPAQGVDLNRMMVTQSRELGLDVEEGDVFDYFKNMEPDSLSAVTGFHIVEHLPLNTMIALFDQAYRVLRPGGMVIFETPNPENIIVGSCNFYYDPTHKNPIPPEALLFLLESRGYRNLEIVRLHENEEFADLKETELSEKVASRFYGAQDYSVIGYKS